MAEYSVHLIKKFWNCVDKDGPVVYPELGPCWAWTGYANRGRGIVKDGGRYVTVAPRMSWELHNGPIPDGLWVLHKCDNPPCTRPEHLFLGTNADNTKDCWNKGRHPKRKSKRPPIVERFGLCECGCGGRVGVYKETNRAEGRIRGELKRFVFGHSLTIARKPKG